MKVLNPQKDTPAYFLICNHKILNHRLKTNWPFWKNWKISLDTVGQHNITIKFDHENILKLVVVVGGCGGWGVIPIPLVIVILKVKNKYGNE